ncbi:hypothetical protein Q5H80_18760 [Vibrio sp. SNU_ST1]|uniref:hypothetical protein n=1 Tax=Vibrio sp. SNU_ST1 TaxID=3064001 RepID=UPI00272C3823|nr:hypothetical protein [Vibrio sp. SNU_ST1]WKY59618.1 hypothetical protein Q5H80_18760 [Vibrio sp. SNU_ST1]
MTPLMEIERIKLYSGNNKGSLKKTGKRHDFERRSCWRSANKISEPNKYPSAHPWYVEASEKVSVTGHHILSVSGVKAASKTKYGTMLKLLRRKGTCPGDTESESQEVLVNVDYLSCIKLEWISSFNLLLHKFGKDYRENGPGCREITDNIEKKKYESKSCVERYHGYNLSPLIDSMKHNNRLKTVFELENFGKGLKYDT